MAIRPILLLRIRPRLLIYKPWIRNLASTSSQASCIKNYTNDTSPPFSEEPQASCTTDYTNDTSPPFSEEPQASCTTDYTNDTSPPFSEEPQASCTTDYTNDTSPPPFSEEPRVNQVGIQYLSNQLHSKVFPTTKNDDYKTPRLPQLLQAAKNHLRENDLLGKKTQLSEPITIKGFPDLVGKTLDEHFYKLGQKFADPYLSMAQDFLSPNSSLPKRPSLESWILQPGWTRYTMGADPEQVPHPMEDSLVFDVEVLYKVSKYPVLATCASSKAWYGWVSPALVQLAQNPKAQLDFNHLIPMDCAKRHKLIIGYNVSYDRARILEEYNIKRSKALYLDGMALHVATSGICSRQRFKWQKYNANRNKKSLKEDDEDDDIDNDNDNLVLKNDLDAFTASPESFIEEDPWLLQGTPNSLANVAEFHCNIIMEKQIRDHFSSLNPMEIIENFPKLMDYCANDVDVTFQVTKKLFSTFFQKIPHPVSFAALKHLGTLILPTTTKWQKYIDSAEACYEKNRVEVINTLEGLANELVRYITENKPELEPDHEKDPWLSQLDWTLKKERLKKDGTPYKNNAFMTGFPEWYRDLFRAKKGVEMNLTLRTRITPLLLRLKWEGYPLFWTNSNGWCFKVPFDAEIHDQLKERNYTKAKLSEEEMEQFHDALQEDGQSFVLFKLPHPDGPTQRCTTVLSKGYVRYFEDGTLTSPYDYAAKIVKLNNEASYWASNRNRIMDQFVVFNEEGKNKFFDTKKESREYKDVGLIIPQLASMGTVTRRATENTWLTASNSKRNRIGSELKSLVEAPEGYCFIGADVDSEELWIASLVGDSMFEIHGGSALGWMTLEGEKSQKTDLHSKTAQILGISRNDAKVFNYGRIYGAGVKFAIRLLKQFNSKISDAEAESTARKLYASTKGKIGVCSATKQQLYHGGSESVMFNALEAIAKLPEPKTPVLGARITDALKASNLNKNTYMTSRVNWTIQSSGVDYLHLLIVSMEYLIEKYNIEARLAITVHDELRYLVREKDKYVAALLLQISNLWTRAMFCEQLGIKEVPQSCAFFSEVDIDHVLRKEVKMDCVTPSQPNAIPAGESLSITELLEKTNGGEILSQCNPKPLTLRTTKYQARSPIIYELNNNLSSRSKIDLIRLQTSVDKQEWKKNVRTFSKHLRLDLTENVKNSESKREEDHILFPKENAITKKKPAFAKENGPTRKKRLVEFDLEEPKPEEMKEERKYKKSSRPSQKVQEKDRINNKKKASSSKKQKILKVEEDQVKLEKGTSNARRTAAIDKSAEEEVSTTCLERTQYASPPLPPPPPSSSSSSQLQQQQREEEDYFQHSLPTTKTKDIQYLPKSVPSTNSFRTPFISQRNLHLWSKVSPCFETTQSLVADNKYKLDKFMVSSNVRSTSFEEKEKDGFGDNRTRRRGGKETRLTKLVTEVTKTQVGEAPICFSRYVLNARVGMKYYHAPFRDTRIKCW
ncbi:MIP1 [Candida oxycetoniae]|uniref:DNA-directed DNA polymerase n=1 Tax=Candida oxycetoniae TaxID=497107 RepID=A0AAI9SWT3_9ASCO|nr:MIP1 [Candida oxycetoniae]KAI3404204.2 MIP1 [Candida oxycetoniae]